MQGRISHAPSVYGGAGGFGTRISQSQSSYFCSSGSLTSYGQTMVIKDGKLTMQNLNDRLASYLETVRHGGNQKTLRLAPGGNFKLRQAI